MVSLWGVCAIERQSASQETITESLGRRRWIGKEIVAMFTKAIVLSAW